MKKRLILASSSPRRSGLLRSAGFRFDIIHPRNVEETKFPDESPPDYALRVCREKGASVCSATDTDNIIISADTIVVLDNRIYGKPQSEQEAFETLKTLSSRTHEVITAYSVLNGRGDLLERNCKSTLVTFKSLAAREIESYIKTGEPVGKAGSYAIQGAGAFMVEKINGSYTNVVGLPSAKVYGLLLNLDVIMP